MAKQSPFLPSMAAGCGGESKRQRCASSQHDLGRIWPVGAWVAQRSESSHFIRRITDGVIAENQGKARGAGDLRVALFPSKHSRVRIPSPALTAQKWPALPPTRRPTSKVHPFFAGSEHTLWPFRSTPSGSPNRSIPPARSRPSSRQRTALLVPSSKHTTAGSKRWRPARYHPTDPANSYSLCSGTAGESQNRRSGGSATCLLNRRPPGW